MRFLVTAGSTLEKIDDVRVWGNIFTGNTGLNIARAIAHLGEVDLLTSNRQHIAELSGNGQNSPHISVDGFATHADLRTSLTRKMSQSPYDAVFMSAAVSDYRPVRVFSVVSRRAGEISGQEQWIVQDAQAPKIRSSHHEIAILGQPTEKLVDLFRSEWNYRGLLVKFKLEVGIGRDELIRIGQASRLGSGAEYLVANTLDMVEGANAGAFLLSDQGAEVVARSDLPARMARLVQESRNLHK